MADISGTNLVAPVVPFTTEDSYPTHMAQYGKGGWRSVQTKAELATIPSQRLEVGMVAYVVEESTPYVYDGQEWKALVIEMDLSKVATEATLIAGIASIEEKIENISPEIDTTELAKEATLNNVSSKIDNIKLPEIDTTLLAKEETLITESQAIQSAVNNIDLSPIESKVEVGVETLSSKIDNIKLPEIDTTELAQESTLQEVSAKLDNLNVDVDLSLVAKQGENQEATNSKILETLGDVAAALTDINETLGTL